MGPNVHLAGAARTATQLPSPGSPDVTDFAQSLAHRRQPRGDHSPDSDKPSLRIYSLVIHVFSIAKQTKARCKRCKQFTRNSPSCASAFGLVHLVDSSSGDTKDASSRIAVVDCAGARIAWQRCHLLLPASKRPGSHLAMAFTL